MRNNFIINIEVKDIHGLDFCKLCVDIARAITKYCGVNNDGSITDINVTYSQKMNLEQIQEL